MIKGVPILASEIKPDPSKRTYTRYRNELVRAFNKLLARHYIEGNSRVYLPLDYVRARAAYYSNGGRGDLIELSDILAIAQLYEKYGWKVKFRQSPNYSLLIFKIVSSEKPPEKKRKR